MFKYIKAYYNVIIVVFTSYALENIVYLSLHITIRILIVYNNVNEYVLALVSYNSK